MCASVCVDAFDEAFNCILIVFVERIFGLLDELVHIVHIRLVMLLVVLSHELLAEIRLECIQLVLERRLLHPEVADALK